MKQWLCDSCFPLRETVVLIFSLIQLTPGQFALKYSGVTYRLALRLLCLTRALWLGPAFPIECPCRLFALSRCGVGNLVH